MLPLAAPHPGHNHLLGALAPDSQARLFPHLEWTALAPGSVLFEAGDVVKHAWFPTDSIVSLGNVLSNGASIELSMVGNEGLVGISLFLGSQTAPNRAIVQNAGQAYRLRGDLLQDAFRHDASLQSWLLRYTQSLITQMAQAAVCNRHHSVEQQLCRWLLMTLDRLPTNQVTMTHESIAGLLGVRREGITEAAGRLQRGELIRYRRGEITVLDRIQLQASCCECYLAVKTETDRLLPYPRLPP
jgi:CRP-like cAMP-binding protein